MKSNRSMDTKVNTEKQMKFADNKAGRTKPDLVSNPENENYDEGDLSETDNDLDSGTDDRRFDQDS